MVRDRVFPKRLRRKWTRCAHQLRSVDKTQLYPQLQITLRRWEGLLSTQLGLPFASAKHLLKNSTIPPSCFRSVTQSISSRVGPSYADIEFG